jgi:hypothetical protein
MKLRYVIEMKRNPGIYWIDETKSPAPVTFATEEEAETYLWKQDALVVMEATVGTILQDM